MPHAPSFERIVVTGGTGFIGQHLLRALVNDGYHPVAIARRMGQIGGLPGVLKEQVRWIELDLLNREDIRYFIGEERPSVLFHLAGTRGVVDQQGNPTSTCSELNVDATLHLLEVVNHAGADRIITIGSAEEYGNQTGPFDEARELQPVSAYGISKAEATRLALAMHELVNCPVVIARLFTVYGPYQPRGMFVSDAINAAVNSTSFSMSKGAQLRDLVFVDDIVAGLIACARTPGVEGKVFNFGGGEPISLRDLAQMIWRISKSSAQLVVGDRPRRDDDMDVTWADVSRARESLGWQPLVDLEHGLQTSIEWARANGSQFESKFVAG